MANQQSTPAAPTRPGAPSLGRGVGLNIYSLSDLGAALRMDMKSLLRCCLAHEGLRVGRSSSKKRFCLALVSIGG